MGCGASNDAKVVDASAQPATTGTPTSPPKKNANTQDAWQGYTSPVPVVVDDAGGVEIPAHNKAAPAPAKKKKGILGGWSFGWNKKSKESKKKPANAVTEPDAKGELDILRRKAHQSLLKAAGDGSLERLLAEKRRPWNKKPSVATWLAFAPQDEGCSLNILLQEDLTIRGGAQLWLLNCGSRLQAAGHNVTFLLPTESLIIEDCVKIDGATVATYDAAAIAEKPGDFKKQFTELLTPANVCVTLVRQQRGEFQNVSFMADCIRAAGLKTFLIAKTGTPDPTYKPHFYGGPLQADKQCCVITIAQYTKDFIVEHMGVPAENITNVYNGTDTAKFKRTPDMAVEALKRYPCATPPNAFVVGCIGSYEERKAQSLLLKAAKKLIDDGRLPNIHCLLVGEGPDKEMLTHLITELGIEAHVSLCEFTKEPFYVFERCNVIALPSTGKEGLPNVLLEALAMEKPCVATNKYGMPEVVIDGKTGYVFPSGDVDALADAIVKIGGVSAEEQAAMAKTGKEMVFAEHDKVAQFEKILSIIKDAARSTLK